MYSSKIKEVRKKNKLSQTEFGEKIGVSRSYIAQLELDKTSPSEKLIKAICEVFNVQLDFFQIESKDFYNKEAIKKHSEIPFDNKTLEFLKNANHKEVLDFHYQLIYQQKILLSLSYTLKELNYNFTAEEKKQLLAIDVVLDFTYKIIYYNAPLKNFKKVLNFNMIEKNNTLINDFSLNILFSIDSKVRFFEDIFTDKEYPKNDLLDW